MTLIFSDEAYDIVVGVLFGEQNTKSPNTKSTPL